MLLPQKLIIQLIKYINAIPPVAAATSNLKFSVGLINPVLYAINNEVNIPNVRKIA